MTAPRITRFYLPSSRIKKVNTGQDRFISRLVDVLTEDGFAIEFHDTESARSYFEGYSVFSMEPPNRERSVTIREAYHPSFHRIEVQNKRWLWQVAQTRFNPNRVDPERAQRFYAQWRQRLFGDAINGVVRDGSILLPLQGKLTEARRFQAFSPVEMISQTAQCFEDRRILVTLHPRENYSDLDRHGLDAVVRQYPNVEVTQRKSFEILQSCDFIVTQNSSVAFYANFFEKPSILFGKIDFHHVALDVTQVPLAEAFEKIATHNPAYAAYVWWFWQKHAINLRKRNSKEKIRARLRKFGWPL